jgi:tetratricopeptide (TPR) repeat protein
MNPSNGIAYNNRGLSYRHQKQLDLAMADFNEAIRLNPNHPAAYVNRAAEYLLMGKYDLAMIDLDHCIRLNPNSSNAHTNRALAWSYGRARNDLAMEDVKEALRLDPKNGFAYSVRGELLARQGRYDQAIADYDHATRLDPNSDEAFRGRAWLLATCPDDRLRDGKRAYQDAVAAGRLSGFSDGRHLDALAAAYAECGDFKNAVSYQEKALGLHAQEYYRKSGQERLVLYRSGKPFRQKVDSESPPVLSGPPPSASEPPTPTPSTPPM